MPDIANIFESNKKWSETQRKHDSRYFSKLAEIQSPEYLWIGCSDSRVPANEIMGLNSGEVFVHRNIANMVIHTDLNCLSVIQYAVDVLKVKNIVICGHYNCTGINAALDNKSHGLIDNWLRHITDIYRLNEKELAALSTEKEVHDRMCELNVLEQVQNISDTTILRDAWERGQNISIHGWVYDLTDGLLRDLETSRNMKSVNAG